ncbi:MAG: FAD-dependent oxidoreductase, partial [Pseudomonadota bacterium]
MTSDAKHVVVIGAGIVGVSSAIWLLRQGHRVTMIDRSEPGEGTSYGNAGLLASAATLPVTTPGLLRKAPYLALNPKQPLFLNWRKLPGVLPWLTQYIRHANAKDAKFRAAAILPLIGDSLNDHQALAKGTGAEDWIVPCDYVYGYTSRAAFQADHFSWSIRRESGFSFRELDGPAFRAYDPIYSDAIGHAAVLANHGRIRDPGRYVKTLAKHAEKQGASVIKAEVNDVVQESGRVSGVRIGGEIIDCDAMVLTAGVWSKNLAEKLKLDVPLQAESGFHLELWEPSVMPRSPVMVSQGKFV